MPTYDVNLFVFSYDVNFVIYHHVFFLFVMYLVNVLSLSFMSICYYYYIEILNGNIYGIIIILQVFRNPSRG